MFECQSAAIGRQGKFFLACRGADELVQLSDPSEGAGYHLFLPQECCQVYNKFDQDLFSQFLQLWEKTFYLPSAQIEGKC